jgi:hypothetical protein
MHRDFKELLSAFNEGHVKYLVVGGYAVSMHAEPRATKDLDILVGADAENSTAPFISRQDLLAAKMAAGRAQDLIDANALRTSAPHRENQPLQSPTEGSRAFETIRQAQERSVEEWLKLRQGQLIDGKMPTLEEIQAKGREEWMRYREQQNEKSQHPNDNIEGKDRPIDSDHEGFTKNDIKEIDDDLGL